LGCPRPAFGSQLEWGTDHATRRAWTVADTFKDDGYFGLKEITRDRFGELIAAIEAGQVDVVIVRDIGLTPFRDDGS
jgi:DNA invertase Pin-like site-specific DNA recombinase